MLTHVSCYDEIWTAAGNDRREEVQLWLLAHDLLPANVHSITLEFQGESATALIEGYVRDEKGDLVLERWEFGCTHDHDCSCTVAGYTTLVQCKTLPPFTRWPHM